MQLSENMDGEREPAAGIASKAVSSFSLGRGIFSTSLKVSPVGLTAFLKQAAVGHV